MILAFGIVLLIRVSLSQLAARTALSTALLALVAGAVIGPGGLQIQAIRATDPIVHIFADVALVAVLFTDGQRANLHGLKQNWRLASRALVLGMPLTMCIIAMPAHWLAHMSWATAFLLAAILSPTDPVFAATALHHRGIRMQLRRLLNVESGLNDGLALPFVLIFLATAQGQHWHLLRVGAELVFGLVLGAGLTGAATLLWRLRLFAARSALKPLGPFAIAAVLYSAAHLSGANAYLAAFAGGATLATVDSDTSRQFQRLGQQLCEATKYGALLVFGALITPGRLTELSLQQWLVAGFIIIAARPLALLPALLRTPLCTPERLAAAWFGPKGFSSVVYGLVVLRSAVPDGTTVFDLVAITITASIVIHTTIDASVARLLFDAAAQQPKTHRHNAAARAARE
nr:cation:proton antiporter [Mycobacterium sp. OAS707]